MAFLRSALPEDYIEPIRAERVVLRPPSLSDFPAWSALRTASREHLAPWEPLWGRNDLTYASYKRRLKHYARECRDDLGYSFFVTDAWNGTLVGGLTLSNVRRGAAQIATLGYWTGAAHVRRGLMTAAVNAVIPYAFEGLRLHRIEAAVMPSNLPSIRVLELNGFAREGLARSYLRINGQWADHYLYARLSDAPQTGGKSGTGLANA